MYGSKAVEDPRLGVGEMEYTLPPLVSTEYIVVVHVLH